MKYELFFERNGIKLYNGDFLDVELPKVDLIVTSPPYNVDKEYDKYEDKRPYKAYLEDMEKWLAKMYRLGKIDTRLCLNLPLDIFRTDEKRGQYSLFSDVTNLAKKVGWNYLSAIVWNKKGVSNRTAWGSWQSASAPYIISPIEMVGVFYKEKWKKQGRGRSTITTKEFKRYTFGEWIMGTVPSSYWHPAPFPKELPLRCIKLFSYKEDLVLDPFCGSGKTLVACMETGRNGIGVEISKEYCKKAVEKELRQLRL